jgi:hypothetical protein
MGKNVAILVCGERPGYFSAYNSLILEATFAASVVFPDIRMSTRQYAVYRTLHTRSWYTAHGNHEPLGLRQIAKLVPCLLYEPFYLFFHAAGVQTDRKAARKITDMSPKFKLVVSRKPNERNSPQDVLFGSPRPHLSG